MYVGNTMKHIQVGNVYDEDFEDSIINPILLGGVNFVLLPKFITQSSIWVRLHKNVIRYVLEICFPNFF